MLKEYTKSRVSEHPEELVFFNSVHLDDYWVASAKNKTQVPGAAYFKRSNHLSKTTLMSAENSSPLFGMLPVKSQARGGILSARS